MVPSLGRAAAPVKALFVGAIGKGGRGFSGEVNQSAATVGTVIRAVGHTSRFAVGGYPGRLAEVVTIARWRSLFGPSAAAPGGAASNVWARRVGG
ncbi:hypothetical protein EB74_07770 [Mycobacterium sp. SWH-M5]|nr:hypothetical protein EB74_07770 [Mycobacterium sp. SWH-M5]